MRNARERKREEEGKTLSPRAPSRRDVRAISRINAPHACVPHAPINRIYNASYRNISPSVARGASRIETGRDEKDGARFERAGGGGF